MFLNDHMYDEICTKKSVVNWFFIEFNLKQNTEQAKMYFWKQASISKFCLISLVVGLKYSPSLSI